MFPSSVPAATLFFLNVTTVE